MLEYMTYLLDCEEWTNEEPMTYDEFIDTLIEEKEIL
jgi:hypothetical protein